MSAHGPSESSFFSPFDCARPRPALRLYFFRLMLSTSARAGLGSLRNTKRTIRKGNTLCAGKFVRAAAPSAPLNCARIDRTSNMSVSTARDPALRVGSYCIGRPGTVFSNYGGMRITGILTGASLTLFEVEVGLYLKLGRNGRLVGPTPTTLKGLQQKIYYVTEDVVESVSSAKARDQEKRRNAAAAKIQAFVRERNRRKRVVTFSDPLVTKTYCYPRYSHTVPNSSLDSSLDSSSGSSSGSLSTRSPLRYADGSLVPPNEVTRRGFSQEFRDLAETHMGIAQPRSEQPSDSPWGTPCPSNSPNKAIQVFYHKADSCVKPPRGGMEHHSDGESVTESEEEEYSESEEEEEEEDIKALRAIHSEFENCVSMLLPPKIDTNINPINPVGATNQASSPATPAQSPNLVAPSSSAATPKRKRKRYGGIDLVEWNSEWFQKRTRRCAKRGTYSTMEGKDNFQDLTTRQLEAQSKTVLSIVN